MANPSNVCDVLVDSETHLFHPPPPKKKITGATIRTRSQVIITWRHFKRKDHGMRVVRCLTSSKMMYSLPNSTVEEEEVVG